MIGFLLFFKIILLDPKLFFITIVLDSLNSMRKLMFSRRAFDFPEKRYRSTLDSRYKNCRSLTILLNAFRSNNDA